MLGNSNVTLCAPSTNVITFVTTFTTTLQARAATGAPSTRFCDWFWNVLTDSGIVQITSADGLPVELMDFSVEGDDPPPTDTEGEDPAEPTD